MLLHRDLSFGVEIDIGVRGEMKTSNVYDMRMVIRDGVLLSGKKGR